MLLVYAYCTQCTVFWFYLHHMTKKGPFFNQVSCSSDFFRKLSQSSEIIHNIFLLQTFQPLPWVSYWCEGISRVPSVAIALLEKPLKERHFDLNYFFKPLLNSSPFIGYIQYYWFLFLIGIVYILSCVFTAPLGKPKERKGILFLSVKVHFLFGRSPSVGLAR